MKVYTFTGFGSLKIYWGGYNVSHAHAFRITGRTLVWVTIQREGRHEVFSNQ